MSHSTKNLTAAELASPLVIDCNAWVAALTYTVQQWLTYRDEIMTWNDNQYHNYGGATQVNAITDALNNKLGRRWWANHG